jgi:hypothetical protein
MADNEKRTKPKYEAPTVVPLSELARGAGACTSGSGDSGACTAGGLASTCTAGPIATVGCTSGGFKR